eukprot:CAMPEP_0114573266 /NCGR_PEP_ID=MMETSP0114-20121206/18770_1 /TAXON_ID=31324 /ORGANISM="Goniomonas sp, Strain m" /LENGTH=288 /DNA_ID=CAMNT_0001760605 /DNA_START=154 /DNA_END=1017 /DNA_ORIENTATION=+
MLDGVTFAGFGEACGMRDFGLTGQPLHPDGNHGLRMQRAEVVNMDNNSMAFFENPNPKWISLSDCIDMDCDGPKHYYVEDMDGTFLGGNGGSIITRAEFKNAKVTGANIPLTLKVARDGTTLPDEQIATEGYGIARPNCTLMPEWNAYRCPSNNVYRVVVIESKDSDREIRRISPLAVAANGWVDLMNGMQDHGWCFSYTCLARLMTFHPVLLMGADYQFHFAGTTPQTLGVHLLAPGPTDRVKIRIHYQAPQRLQVFVGDRFVEDVNWFDGRHKSDLVRAGRWASNN